MLVSAITIPDMIRIIEHHGLVAVPVDIDPERMAPSVEQWQQAITPATRLMLVAHLFGGRTEMGPIVELARQHNLLVVEDCAQAFAGVEYEGNPQADASMFSFGSIKNSTGARRGDSSRSRRGVARADACRPGKLPFAAALALFQAAGEVRDVQGAGGTADLCPGCAHLPGGGLRVRPDGQRGGPGFPGADFFSQIRHRPSAPLLAMLERRLKRRDGERCRRHAAKGKAMTESLHNALSCPGTAVDPNTFWVFPVIVDKPVDLVEHLTRAGFDATQGQSLCVVSPPADRAARRATAAEELLANVVFLPFYPELPPREAHRLANTVLAFHTNGRATVKRASPSRA